MSEMSLFTLHNAVPNVHWTIKSDKMSLKDFLFQSFLVVTVVLQVLI